jgi:ribosomal-protein-alanine N-acetyltransferase
MSNEPFVEVPTLETERLILRAITVADAPALFSIFGDAEVTRFYDLETFTTIDEAEALARQFASTQAAGRGLRWGIQPRGQSQLIGTVGFNDWAQASRRCGLGYDLARSQWGSGLVPEALRAILAHGFVTLGLNRIEAFVMQGNDRSMRLLRKLGFREEGILRQRGAWKGRFHDLTLFALLQSEYFANQEV